MILITGAGGQLGRAVVETCVRRGLPHRARSRTELDVTDPTAVTRALASDLECIIHCAAYTAVDRAETEREAAFAANARAPLLLARSGVPILLVSTDYVFDGESVLPYAVDAPTRPLSVYGESKRAGEVALLEGGFEGAVVRTSWVWSKRPGTANFYQTVRRLLSERAELRVVDDQVAAPTLAEDLADFLVTLFERNLHRLPMRILHYTNRDSCSRFEFAQAVAELEGSACRVVPIATRDYPTPARRPAHSVLSLDGLRALGIEPRSWRDTLFER